ncbi:MAG: patatin-like phospholipase family protein [Hyphomicrobiaceae bacterium]|nr:patatin-like phospholipase family protein [Hyphomicrobiaceae bacterium]
MFQGLTQRLLQNEGRSGGSARESGASEPGKPREPVGETPNGAPDDIQWQGLPRPTIGLALGGGAARGWAHIGVLRACMEAGIKPDVIAGTSIGAVVGGCYAAGKLDELEEFARGLSPRRVLSLLDLSLGGSGLLNGAKLDKLLRQHLGDSRIEDLDVRMIAVATELKTGHEIWLRRGVHVDLMRASYALPGIFKPVAINSRFLVDGALVNPVPVSVCRAYGARLVIAVNLNADFIARGTVVPDLPEFDSTHPQGLEDIPDLDASQRGTIASGVMKVARSAQDTVIRQFTATTQPAMGVSGVMMQSFNIIQDRLTRSRLAGDPPDLTIGPRVGDVGLFDFHRAEETINAGYEAAKRALDEAAFMQEALT